MSNNSGSLSYTYTPLASSANFRLLQLELNSNGDRLECELCEYPVGQAPPYICLSYCWGLNKDIKDAIYMQGNIIYITDTVSMALRSIRAWKLEEHDAAPVMVWIDYICINQEDNAERAVQVGHMKALYSQAELVLVYLGAQDQGSERLPELYQQLRSTHDRYYQDPKSGEDKILSVGMRDLSLRELDGTGLLPRGDPIWDMHRAFLQRPWFLRTWIIQEAVLARRLFFICGGWGVNGYLLTNAWHIIMAENLMYLFSTASVEESMEKNPAEGRAMHQILLMLNLGMGKDTKQSPSLIDLLQTSRSAMVTDPRDYVYGLLGLASDSYRAKVAVDYEEPVVKTYRRVAKIVVEEGDGAKLLYNLHGLDTDLDLPSWIPDWSNQHFPFFSLSPMPGSTSTTLDIPYLCAGGSQAEMRVSDDGNNLHCVGYIVDVVDRLTDAKIDDDSKQDDKKEAGKSTEDEVSHSYKYLCRCISELAAFLATKSVYPPGTHDEIIWRTVIWNRPRSHQKKVDMQYEDLYRSFQDHVKFRNLSPQRIVEQSRPRMKGLDKEIGFLVPGDVATKIILQETDAVQDQAEKFANWATTLCIRMKRCGTMKGYVGHVPKGAQIGDVICVIAGAAVPFALRETAEGYRVVGQCYLHGIMEGEALQNPSLYKKSIILV